MNFTREPILETIISAKEGYKLSIKSTKSEGSAEYLVEAVEVVCFGTTYFYRSAEPAHTFFVPAQDFEIVQVRQTRLVLKTPTEKNIKIAGGDNLKSQNDKKKSKSKTKSSEKKSDSKKEDKKTNDVKTEASEEKTSKTKDDSKKDDSKKDDSKKEEVKGKKDLKSKASKKTNDKKKAASAKKTKEEIPSVPTSMFSHLLRPPESLISDNIEKYHTMQGTDLPAEKKEVKLTKEVEITEEIVTSTDNPIDDPNLTSEPPQPFEKLTEEDEVNEVIDEKPLSLKEKVKQVLSPSIKQVIDSGEDAGK
ncbi:MAG: hypothetical protein S4CHLAM20_06900 [Chlamydiia bacterium]|nr:hypothetical protein [Chlamydiia bacterium]